MKIDGSCHCGSIRYEAEVDPARVYICHCTDCQSITGSAFRWAVSVAEDDFTILSGKPKTYLKTSDGGATSHQLFCPDCASPLYAYSETEGPRFFNLRVGTARQRADLTPKSQYWCRSSQNWIDILGATKGHDTQ